MKDKTVAEIPENPLDNDTADSMDGKEMLYQFLLAMFPQDDPNTPFEIQRDVTIQRSYDYRNLRVVERQPSFDRSPLTREFKKCQILDFGGLLAVPDIYSLQGSLACLYEYASENSLYPFLGEVGLTVFCKGCPTDLLLYLAEHGQPSHCTVDGIYVGPNVIGTDIQFVVLNELMPIPTKSADSPGT